MNSQQKHHLAHLFNAFGYYDKWLRHLAPPAYPTCIITQGHILVSPTDSSDSEIDMVCAVLSSGGHSRAFPDARQPVNGWQLRAIGNPDSRPRSPRKAGKKKATSSIIATVKKDFEDLIQKFPYHQVTITREEYLLFDVPYDHQCLFHTHKGVFSPVYTSTWCHNHRTIRIAVIQFYRTCRSGL